jgi:hypothetical protein
MNGLMQYYYAFQNISARDESSLCRIDDFLGHPSDAVSTYFSENFEAHIEKANRSVLFDTTCILFFG